MANAVVSVHGMARTVTLPPGATILAAQTDGDRVMIRLRLAAGGEELMLLDWRSGANLGAIELRPANEGKPP